MKTVMVAMSGGVDSSVTALLLQKEGYRVLGGTFVAWEGHEQDGKDVVYLYLFFRNFLYMGTVLV